MFTDANCKFCSNCLGFWVKCRRQLICLDFGGLSAWILGGFCMIIANEGHILFWSPCRTGISALRDGDVNEFHVGTLWMEWTTFIANEQSIQNALLEWGRVVAEGWAVISRGEGLAEPKMLTHLTTCSSWVSHLTIWQVSNGIAARLVSKCA